MKLFVITILMLAGCASVAELPQLLDEAIYEISERDCVGNNAQISFCEEIQLIELVKGKFYKVKETETAFVVWSGRESDLAYNVTNIGELGRSQLSHIVIRQGPEYMEVMSSDSRGNITYKFGEPNKHSSLVLRRIPQSKLSEYSKAYPVD